MDMENFGMVDYSSIKTPPAYKCSKCGVTDVKLWRYYNTFLEYQELFCLKCACHNQKKTLKTMSERTDKIGSLIPAVPTENGDTFWGYSSVPQDGCEWWYNLPTLKGGLK